MTSEEPRPYGLSFTHKFLLPSRRLISGNSTSEEKRQNRRKGLYRTREYNIPDSQLDLHYKM